ncbi:MAG TPA: hypothetical protein VF384_15665 [Planctomycetota bacterium]
MAEKLSVDDACAELGISRSRFDQLRTQMLLACIAEMSPRPTGRAKTDSTVSPEETQAQQQLIAAQAREIAMLRAQLEVVAIRAQGERRSKSGRSAAARPSPPRPNAAGGAVP